MEPVVRFAALRAVQLTAPGHPSLVSAYAPGEPATPFLAQLQAASPDTVTGRTLANTYLSGRGVHPFAALIDRLGRALMASASARELLTELAHATDAAASAWNPLPARARCADDLLAMALEPAILEADRTVALQRMKVVLVVIHARSNDGLSGRDLGAWANDLVVLLPAEARRRLPVPPIPPKYSEVVPSTGTGAGNGDSLLALLDEGRNTVRRSASSGGSGHIGTVNKGTVAKDLGPAKATAKPVPTVSDVTAAIEKLNQPSAKPTPTTAGTATQAPAPRAGALVRPPGIMDLLVVRQTPIGYEAGEIAHIENVMQQETRERLHRRVDTTEVTDVVTEERISEQEKETQTTARADLSTEATSLARLDARVAGHVNTSGQYGPTKVVTDVSGGVNYSRENGERNATSYAKELTERASSKLVERTERQRTTRSTTQIDEMVKHVVEAKGATAHIIGIYRWVNRIYDCSLWRYEGRMVCEFEIPEPSSWYRWWRDRERAVPGVGTPPPTLAELGVDRVEAIGVGTPAILQAKLGLTGLPELPPFVKRVPFTLSKMPAGPWNNDRDDAKGAMEFLSKEVTIPEGYSAMSVSWQARTVGLRLQAWLKVGTRTNIELVSEIANVNTAADTWMRDTSGADVAIPDQPSGALTVAASFRSAGVEIIGEITCFVDNPRIASWQFAIQGKAVAAVEALRVAYESRTRAGSVLRPQISARPSVELRAIEHNELKRSVIELLEGPGTIGDEGWTRDDASGPVLEPDVARYGRTVQFMEQAFEWGNLDQIYYPYFWAARDRWDGLVAESDADPQFADFLRCGSARVTVPVAPGFELLVQAYLAGFGVWGGGAAPAIDDPLYRGIAAEILERMNGPAGGRQVGASWRLSLPTTLVHLQASGELPAPPPLPVPIPAPVP